MDNVGTIEYDARINLSGLKKDSDQADRIAKDTGDGFEDVGKRGSTSFLKMGAVIGGVAGVVQSVTTKAMESITQQIGNAIDRVDTLGNSARTFENMGFSAEQTSRVMKDLTKSIEGLPTPLDDAVSGVQLLASSTNNLEKSQKIYESLNNAILGFGGGAFEVENAIKQLSQAFSNGRVDAETYNSLIDAQLGPALNAIARDMGLTLGQLKQGLSDGSVSVEQFQDALIKMNEEGGGGLKSFQQIAQDSTAGIATGVANAETAITRGVAKIIEAIGPKNISGAIAGTGKTVETILGSIAVGFGFIKTTVDQIGPVIGRFFNDLIGALKPVTDFIANNKQAWEGLKLAIMGIAAVIGIVIISVGVGLVLAFAALQVIINVVMNIIQAVTNTIVGFIGAVNTGVATVENFGRTMINTFSGAVSGVMSLLNGLLGFFSYFWGSVTGIFGRVGTVVGDAIGGAFRSVINTIVGRAAGIINGFIDAINNVVGAIDAIPGVDIGRIGRLPVPQLAAGGVVTSPTLAMVGEGRESEAVIPLSKLDSMLSNEGATQRSPVTVTVHMDGIMSRSKADERDIAKNLIRRVNEELRAKGAAQIGQGVI